LTLPGGRFGFCAPTFDQARRIAWDDLKAMTRPYWYRRPSEDRLVIYAGDGGELHVVGMDKPSRIEGTPWNGLYLDEYGDMKEDVWTKHVQPVTADTGAWVDFGGVPEGLNHYYSLAEYARTSGDPLFDFFTWYTADVQPPDVIEAARRMLDERSFQQEYEGRFVSAGRLTYYAFGKHNVEERAFDPTAETWLAWDFNASEKPMSVVVIQRRADRPGCYHVPVEFVKPYTQTETMATIVSDYLDAVGFTGRLHIRGDYAGNAIRSTATVSDYNILERVFRNRTEFEMRTRPTRKIRNRTNALNSLLRSASGDVRMTIDPSCRKLIADLERVEWKENEVELDGSNPERTHPSDALTYFAHIDHPTDVRDVETSFRR
jgi:hypothetical protein